MMMMMMMMMMMSCSFYCLYLYDANSASSALENSIFQNATAKIMYRGEKLTVTFSTQNDN